MPNITAGIIPSEDDIANLCNLAGKSALDCPNVITVNVPTMVCGDIHGQFPDLVQLFALGGNIPESNYLFLGDYVDRGLQSVECVILLLALKVRYPLRIHLLRGNHESRAITKVYGFYDECLKKFGHSKIWRSFMTCFDSFPLAALINDSIFCVHGGLSPEIQTLDQLRSLDRFIDVPIVGPMSDLLWSDPEGYNGWQRSPRGAGFLFGADVTSKFLANNGLELICRSHQLVMEGYRWWFDRKLLTVWSAPNYCFRCGNVAAVLDIDENLTKTFIVFEASESTRKPPPKTVSNYFL